MIEKLTWDSEFFGYTVGRIQLSEGINLHNIRSMTGFDDFKLVYIFSDQKLPAEFDKNLVASRVHFYKKLAVKNSGVEVTPFIVNVDSYDELMRLGLQSGILSRFRVDRNFKNNEYQRLYKQWINKSLNDPKGRVLVVRSEKGLAGFITFEFLDGSVTRFGLIAVDIRTQSKGLGSLLVKMAENECIDCGMSEVHVSTHFENKPAMAILLKNSFKLISTDFIYHIWNI